MLRGIYSSAAGMVMEMDKVSMHAQNIANAQSAGYRGREMSSVPFKELMIDIMQHQQGKPVMVPVGTGSGASLQAVNATQGSLKPTGNTFDLAIEGNGWLTFRKGGIEGTNEYTSRNGRMMLNNEGFITNAEGHFLVDQAGKNVRIAKGRGLTAAERAAGLQPPPVNPDEIKSVQSRVTIDDNGKVFDSGKLLASLKIQQDTNTMQAIPELKLMIPVQQVIPRDPNSGNLMINVNAPAANTMLPGQREKVAIKQGFIESSNVSIISEMISLIHASKDYESGHKLIMSEDKILDKAINELGRTG